jgi:hypothetical protein
MLCVCAPVLAQMTDPCAGATCGGHGQCFSRGGIAYCACHQGYTLDPTGLNCVPVAPAPAPTYQPPPAPPQPAGQQWYGQSADQGWQGQPQPGHRDSYKQWLERQYARGYISRNRFVSGGLVGTLFGFGIGHGIHRSYSEFGWFFTVSESITTLVIAISGVAYLNAKTDEKGVISIPIFAGLGVLGALKIWETIDVWVRGKKHLVNPNEFFRQRAFMLWPAPFVLNHGGGIDLAGRF